jgi:hypothetical protein
MTTNTNTTTQVQTEFADRLGEVLVRATNLMPHHEVFEAAIGAAAGFALQHADGPAIAETLRRLAAELQSRRGIEPGTLQ